MESRAEPRHQNHNPMIVEVKAALEFVQNLLLNKSIRIIDYLKKIEQLDSYLEDSDDAFNSSVFLLPCSGS